MGRAATPCCAANRCSPPASSSGSTSPASPPSEVLDVIPLFHPIWADADPDDVTFADSHAAHGNFRAWAQLTARTSTAPALARTGRARVDQELLRWAFSRLS
ncbi:hypothetical protein [Streptomyces cinnamoneus]|uniref:hypothetical protein n=1 Tax=Streptomyces cinnamoneus TaxID=53446 RepID=UPI0037AB950F